MKKNLGLLALTGIIALASCSQGNPPAATNHNLTINSSNLDAAAFTITKAGGTAKSVATVKGTYTESLVSGNYTVVATPVTGYTVAPASQSADLTSTNQTVTFTYTKDAVTPPAATSAVLTINLEGVSKAPVTIKDSKGAVVAGYNNVAVTNGEKLTLPKDAYTIIAGDVANFTAPTGSAAANLTNGDASVKLTYTAVGVGTPSALASIKITSPATGSTLPSGAAQVVFNTTGTLTKDSVFCTVNGVDVSANLANTSGICTVNLPDVTGPVVITVKGKDANGKDVSDSVVVNVTAAVVVVVPVAPITLDATQNIDKNAFASCTTKPGLDGWLTKTDVGNGNNYPTAGQTNYFVKGKVRVNLSAAVTNTDVVEAYYKSTQPGSAVQKLDVQTDPVTNRKFVMFDSSYGAEVSNAGPSHEGYATTLWFRVNNNDVNGITLVPDNLAPEAINPEVDAARRINQNGQIYVAGDINFYSANKAIEDKPLGSDGALNAGFEHVCYFVVPATQNLNDYSGDNPVGLKNFNDSIREASVGAYSSPTPIVSAGALTPGVRFFGDKTFMTAVATPGPNGFIPVTKNIPDGFYKVYAITTDKLGNERPSSTPFKITIDNTAPKLSNVAVNIVDDSPLPFPASDGYVSDYAKINVTGSLAGSDGNGIGVDYRSAVCSFNNMNLFETVDSANINSAFRYANMRVDSNKWADGLNKVDCGRNVKDLLGNYDPANLNGTQKSITVDNIDPTLDLTSPDMPGTLVSGRLYRPEAQVRDAISGVRSSHLFWNALKAIPFSAQVSVAPGLFDVDYAGYSAVPVPLINPIEIIRGDSSKSSIGGLDWRAPSFDDQNTLGFSPNGLQIGIEGLAIDNAGNATLRTKTYSYTSDGQSAFPIAATFKTGVYNASSFPLNDSQKNNIPFGRNTIAGVTAADTAPNSNRVAITNGSDATLEIDARTVAATYGTLEVPKVYGRFNSIDWQAVRNYMLTPAIDQNDMAFPGSAVRGDLRDATIPTYADNLTQSNTGDPSYLAQNANRTTADLRADWNLMLAPWMTLSGVTNTPDVNNRYTMTNSLLNPLVQGASKRYPVNCPTDTYCTPFSKYYDQVNAIFTAGDGDFIFTGRNVSK